MAERMKGRFLGIVLAAGLLALASCAMNEKSQREYGLSPLTQNELEALFSRTRTYSWIDYMGKEGTGTDYPDGKMQIYAPDEISGSWRIRGDKFCFEIPSSQEDMCSAVIRTQQNEYKLFRPDGSYYMTFSFTN
jgi:hypothetical protein